jgi:hypothetical protein
MTGNNGYAYSAARIGVGEIVGVVSNFSTSAATKINVAHGQCIICILVKAHYSLCGSGLGCVTNVLCVVEINGCLLLWSAVERLYFL